MTISADTFPLTALIVPLLTCGAAWAIAVWALKQDSSGTEFLQRWNAPTAARKREANSVPSDKTRTILYEKEQEHMQ